MVVSGEGWLVAAVDPQVHPGALHCGPGCDESEQPSATGPPTRACQWRVPRPQGCCREIQVERIGGRQGQVAPQEARRQVPEQGRYHQGCTSQEEGFVFVSLLLAFLFPAGLFGLRPKNRGMR